MCQMEVVGAWWLNVVVCAPGHWITAPTQFSSESKVPDPFASHHFAIVAGGAVDRGLSGRRDLTFSSHVLLAT